MAHRLTQADLAAVSRSGIDDQTLRTDAKSGSGRRCACVCRYLKNSVIVILMGDEHRIVREGLKYMLADAPDVCVMAEASPGLRNCACCWISTCRGKTG